ncbi:MAG TPA: chemotaxis protein CheW [Thermodesulfovibrionales bacterium]|nr:chemotaxis protein CheW [Thermodesulfovibrionales bacterium]
MDIAKIRRKVRNTASQDSEGQDRVPEKEPTGDFSPEISGGIPAVEKDEKRTEKESLPAAEDNAGSLVDLLTFTLANEDYAFRIEDVEEIVRPQRVTSIPKASPALLGITSLRGKIIPVIDLRKMLSLDGDAGDERRQKILILKGLKGPFGAMIDRVVGVIRLPASGIVDTPAHLPDAKMKFIEGVAIVEGRFISILRMEEVIIL